MSEKSLEQNENKVIKDIESGKYRNQYLIYNRKSTDEADNQKNSIKFQKAENVRYAYREHLPIAPISLKGFCLDGIISEKHSGFKEDTDLVFGKDNSVKYRIERPKFYRLVQYLNKGYFKGVIVLCWDRASRNKGDNTVIEKLMKQGVDFRFILASYDKTSSGALHMDIDGMFAQHHSRVTSEKVSLAIANLRNKGIWPHKAPIGYLNTGAPENKPLDPKRAPIVKQMFELYATNEWSLADISRWANELGLTMPPLRRRRTKEEILAEEEDDEILAIERVERPVTVNAVHRILTNRFYTGKTHGLNGELMQSIGYEALVTEELFEKVQRCLQRKKVSTYYTEKVPCPYRGLVRCEFCKRVYTPYIQKGILYYGARCRIGCQNTRRSFNASFLEAQIGNKIWGLSFTDNELAELDARTQTDIALFEMKRNGERDGMDRKKRKIREDLTYLRINKLALLRAGVYSPETYFEEETRLTGELSELQEQEQVFDLSMHEVIKDVIYLSELLKDLYLYYQKAKSPEKEEITKKLFSELWLSENSLQCKCKNGLQALESRLISNCAPNEWISELINYGSAIKLSITELHQLKNAMS